MTSPLDCYTCHFRLLSQHSGLCTRFLSDVCYYGTLREPAELWAEVNREVSVMISLPDSPSFAMRLCSSSREEVESVFPLCESGLDLGLAWVNRR